MGSLTQLLIGSVLAVVASIISAFVTVQLSLKRFRSERWWEKKVEAYSRLIEELALFQINSEWWSNQYDMYKIGVFTSTDEDGRLAKEANELRESVKKTTAVGAYIISEQAAGALKVLREEFDKACAVAFDGDPDTWAKANDMEYEATKQCIAELRECAKADLGLK